MMKFSCNIETMGWLIENDYYIDFFNNYFNRESGERHEEIMLQK